MKTKIAEPELGQAMFGNPMGQYECPDFVEALISSLFEEIDRIYWNINQRQRDTDEDPDFPEIKIRPYYWGECTCGWDEISFDEPHEPTCYQELVDKELVEQHKFVKDEDGYVSKPEKMSYDKGTKIEDAVREKYCKQFGLMYPEGCAVHCTCKHDKDLEKWFILNRKGPNGHATNCESELPNFSYKDVELRWYKHFGRSMSLNTIKSEKQWREWFDDCLQYIRKQNPPM